LIEVSAMIGSVGTLGSGETVGVDIDGTEVMFAAGTEIDGTGVNEISITV
jgi:hypothetical protein